ncbi:exocyst complex component Sec6-domain-containing protein [Jimgerdemannia flammicorona]|uniref:Exocyst complex component Sec6-domain-containing protein n=1 Tax=Jimgerdemannia flammicorona TaxID=994334 RepID=A0A433DCU3_9FUNG|nr:exocyst complex component Sec6-domain-containing protein [Jimgerdemannia flammicorona]
MDIATYGDARDAAVARLAELLKHPDDLNLKVPALRRKFAKEKASVEAQLKTGVQTQLDSIQGGLDTLAGSTEQMNKIKNDMQRIDNLCAGSQGMIQHFPRINKISRVHQNFVATQEKIKSLQGLYHRLEEVQRMFDEDHRDIFGPAENMLHVHYQLFKLEEFRDATLHQARGSSPDVIINLKTYFRKLDVLSDDFTHYLWDLGRNALELVKRKRGSVIVRLVKIIECEERADEKAQAAEQARTSHQELASEGSKWRLAEGSPRTIKSYRVQFFDVLHESLTERFDRRFAEFGDDWSAALDATDFIFSDLTLVFDELVPKFPKKYKIFPFFVLEYHRHVYEQLNQMIQQDLDAGTILKLLRFVRDYYASMSSQLGVTEELLEPKLLDGQEQALVEDYLKLVRRKLVEWTTNLMNTESRDFIERDKPPEHDSDGHYGMTAAVIMFQMINQQIDVAVESNQGKLLYHVVSECHRVLKDSQRVWKELLGSELRKQIERPDEVPEGFVDYVMAVANDNVRSADFTEAIVHRLENLVDAKYKAQVDEKLNTVMDGFLQVSTFARGILLDVTFNDVRPIFGQMFCPAWYDEELMPLVIATLKDYCKDYQQHLNGYLFGRLVDEMLERFLVLYLEAARSKQAKFRMPQCLDKIRSDVRLAYNFFVKFKAKDELETQLDVIENVHTMLESNRRSIFLDYHSFRQAYPDVPLVFVEDLLARRDDLDKSGFKEIMEGIRAKAKEYEPDMSAPPTVFSKMKW